MQLQAVEGTEEPAHIPQALRASLKALGNPWRNRILFELHLRPMSPKQFAEEFGGPPLTSIARYFRELKSWGLIEVAAELRGGGRRGATQKLYRAIRKLYFDTETWAQLPRYLRNECSGLALESLVFRVAEALQAETLSEGQEHHLSTGAFALDQVSWEAVINRLDSVLDWMVQLEVEAAARMAITGEEPLHLTAALLAFRSFTGPGIERDPMRISRTVLGPPAPCFLMDPLTAKALSDPWRNRILCELHLRPMSPRQFGEELGGPDLAATARYFRQLKNWGYLEVVEQIRGGRRRGAVEKVYRAVRRVHFNTGPWQSLPVRMRQSSIGLALGGLIGRVEDALVADILDIDSDRHTSWVPLWLDRQAWEECLVMLRGTTEWLGELKAQSAERLRGSLDEAIPVTVAVLGFRSPGAFPCLEMSEPLGCALDPSFQAAA